MKQQQDSPQTIDIDPGMAVERLDSWIDGLVRLAPNILVALLALAVFIALGSAGRRLVIRSAKKRDRTNLGELLGGLLKWVVIVVGGLFSATIVFPNLNPGDLIAGLGVSSVAIGFAFKDILQNWLAGLLILLRQPFEIGDQIKVEGFEGTVRHIETRATILKTYDGQKVLIPNSEIYSSAVLVKTAFEQRRSQYDIGIGYGDDVEEACRVIRQVLEEHPDIDSEPAPQALPWDLAASWVTIRARWWTDTRRADIVRVRSQVIQEVKRALDAAGIDMPYETRVQLVHDQTEATDGDRSAQREGWPAPAEGGTEPRWKAQAQLAEPREAPGQAA